MEKTICKEIKIDEQQYYTTGYGPCEDIIVKDDVVVINFETKEITYKGYPYKYTEKTFFKN